MHKMFNRFNASNDILIICLIEFFEVLAVVSTTSILALFMSEFLNLSIGLSFFIVGVSNFATACVSIFSSVLADKYIGIEKTMSFGYIFAIFSILCFVGSYYLNNDFSIYLFYLGFIIDALGIGFIEVHLYSLIKLFTKNNEHANNYIMFNMACLLSNVLAPFIMGIVLYRSQNLNFGDCFLVELVFLIISLVLFIRLKNNYSIRDNYKTKSETGNLNLGWNIFKYVLFLSFMASIGSFASAIGSTSNLYLSKDFAASFISLGSLNLYIAPQTYLSISIFMTFLVSCLFLYYKNRFKRMHNLFNYYILGMVLYLVGYLIIFYVCNLIDLGYSDLNPLLFIIGFSISGMSFPFIATISTSFLGKIVPKNHISKCFAIALFIQGLLVLFCNYLTGLYPITGTSYLFGIIPIINFKSFILIFITLFAIVLICVLIIKFKTRKEDDEFYLI